MANETPDIPTVEASETAVTGPSISSEETLVMDAPDYIDPDQQNMTFTDITSEVLHSNNCTILIGRGNAYLSEADRFSQEWPATGVIYGYNKRLMISLPCRRARPSRGHKILNVFFLVDTGSHCSYLCQEAMTALIGNPASTMPEQLLAVVNDESCKIPFFMSPLGTEEASGKFRDANVLGMDFLQSAGLCLTVDTPIHRFRLFKSDDQSMYETYSEEKQDG